MEQTQKPEIYIIKTSINQERNVADALYNRAKDKNIILSLLFTPRFKGYLFVETKDLYQLSKIIKTVNHVRGLVKGGSIDIKELEILFTPKPVKELFNVGAIVEISAGPFKGEKARIQYIDTTKEEVTVELIESMIPIPITLKSEVLRLIEKSK